MLNLVEVHGIESKVEFVITKHHEFIIFPQFQPEPAAIRIITQLFVIKMLRSLATIVGYVAFSLKSYHSSWWEKNVLMENVVGRGRLN